jgi:hypothetical protein
MVLWWTGRWGEWGKVQAVAPWSRVYVWYLDLGPLEVRKMQPRRVRGAGGGAGTPHKAVVC